MDFNKTQSIYEANLNALRESAPDLVKKLSHFSPSPLFHLIHSDSSDPTLELEIGKGAKSILFHSRRDPKKEALRQIELQASDLPCFYFFAGLGLGYTLEALVEHYPKTINAILLLERDLTIFYYFLHRRDWSLLFSNPRFRIVISENPETITQDAMPFLPQIMSGGVRFIDHKPSFQIYPTFYTDAIEQFRLLLKRAAVESEFLIQHGALIQRNAILNLPAMCASHGLGPLRGFYRDQPAVLIGAGPSLNKNLHLLAVHRSKVLVFCVDTCYRLVREHGIIPDFVSAIDPTDLNVTHFEDIEPDPREVLIFESDVHPDIPRKWTGSSIFLNSEKAAINRWIEEIAGPFGNFEPGLSVGHTLFNAAAWMHCNPIILIGYDLAYPEEGGGTHADGTLYKRLVKKAVQEENHIILQPAPFHPSPCTEKIEWVLGVRGRKVPTSKTMAVFLRELSDRIKESKLTIFDATEGGALIEGTIPSRLDSILSTLESRPPLGDIVPFLEEHRDPQDEQRLLAFDQLIEGLQSAQDMAREAYNRSMALLMQYEDVSNHPVMDEEEWEKIDHAFWTIYRSDHIQTALGQALFSSLFLFLRQKREDDIPNRLTKYASVFKSVIQLSEEFIPYVQNSRDQIAQSCQDPPL
ncbi:MAG: motility associated factor glycosyltransferase family protein [Candidatus Omnitrophica bacterium]|nr:motility associated factor glycosyltransferase family protein [Candidatus Omnitrophota bacterium]